MLNQIKYLFIFCNVYSMLFSLNTITALTFGGNFSAKIDLRLMRLNY